MKKLTLFKLSKLKIQLDPPVLVNFEIILATCALLLLIFNFFLLPPAFAALPNDQAGSLTVIWNRPAGYVEFSDFNRKLANCWSPGLSCATGQYIYWPGSSIIYSVRAANSSGSIIGIAGTSATGDGRAIATWSWNYEVLVFLANTNFAELQSSPPINTNLTQPSFTFSNLRPSTQYSVVVCAPNCGAAGNNRIYVGTQTSTAVPNVNAGAISPTGTNVVLNPVFKWSKGNPVDRYIVWVKDATQYGSNFDQGNFWARNVPAACWPDPANSNNCVTNWPDPGWDWVNSSKQISTIDPGNLIEGHNYVWAVVTCRNLGCTDWSMSNTLSFTTLVPVVGQPISPPPGSNNPVFKWGKSNPVDHYTVWMKANSNDFASGSFWAKNVPGICWGDATSCVTNWLDGSGNNTGWQFLNQYKRPVQNTPGFLGPGNYSWMVVTCRSADCSEYGFSSIANFAVSGNKQPATGLSQTVGACDSSKQIPVTFSWTTSTDPGIRAQYLDISSTDPNFGTGSFISSQVSDVALTGWPATFTGTNPINGTVKWYWRINTFFGWDVSGNQRWSPSATATFGPVCNTPTPTPTPAPPPPGVSSNEPSGWPGLTPHGYITQGPYTGAIDHGAAVDVGNWDFHSEKDWPRTVYSNMDGKVIQSGTRTGSCWKDTEIIRIQNDISGYTILYQHLESGSRLVKEGEIVKRGQPIARVGNTGCADTSFYTGLSATVLHYQFETGTMDAPAHIPSTAVGASW